MHHSLFAEQFDKLSDLTLERESLKDGLEQELPSGAVGACIWRNKSLRLRIMLSGGAEHEQTFREHVPGKLLTPSPVGFVNHAGHKVTAEGIFITKLVSDEGQRAEGTLDRAEVIFTDEEAAFSLLWIANMPKHPLCGHWPESTDFEKKTTLQIRRASRTSTISTSRRGGENTHFTMTLMIDGTATSIQVGKERDKHYGFVELDRAGARLDEDAKRRLLDCLGFILGRPLALMSETWFDEHAKPLRKVYYSAYLHRNSKSEPDLATVEPRKGVFIEARPVQNAVQKLLDNYRDCELLNVFWNFWTARSISPQQGAVMFGSAFETLRDAYYRKPGREKRTSILEGEAWTGLKKAMAAALDGLSIEKALADKFKGKIEFLNSVSSRELSQRFLDDLGLTHGSVEDAALKFRNTGAHGSKVAKDVDYQALMLSYRALQTLLCRTILRLCDVDEKYVDHSTYGHPHRLLTEPLGGPESDGRPTSNATKAS